MKTLAADETTGLADTYALMLEDGTGFDEQALLDLIRAADQHRTAHEGGVRVLTSRGVRCSSSPRERVLHGGDYRECVLCHAIDALRSA